MENILGSFEIHHIFILPEDYYTWKWMNKLIELMCTFDLIIVSHFDEWQLTLNTFCINKSVLKK
jgi:hypothetical protein